MSGAAQTELDEPPWSRLDIWTVRYCAQSGRTLREASELLDRSQDAVGRKADALGVKFSKS